MRSDDLKKYICEFIGTYALVFFAAGAVMVSAMTDGGLGAIGGGLISGLVLMIVIFTFAHISGGHVNPAFSIATVYLGLLERRLLPGYIVAQMLGSAAAGLSLLWSLGSFGDMGANLPNTGLGISPFVALLIETFLSFLLMLVIAGSLSAGVEVMLMGPVAGAAMNPARAFGPYVAMGDFTHYWIYVAGPIVGMMAGAVLFRYTHGRFPIGAAAGEAREGSGGKS
jgi:glycerol uptake facilitator-like aquaporin